jgi:hypothetical protein
MTRIDRKWLPAALIALAGLASVAAYGRLPALVDLRFGGLLPFAVEAEGPAPRWLVLSGMPVLALVMFALFRLAPTAAGERVGRRMFRHAPNDVSSRAQFERFGRTYDAIVLGVVMLLVGGHAAVLAAAFQAPDLAARLVPAVFGASLVLMGNVMPRLRPNWVAGLRSRRVLADPQLWRSTHRVFGAAFVVSGIVTIATAAAAPEYGLLVGIVSVLASCVIGYVASTRERGASPRATLVV